MGPTVWCNGPALSCAPVPLSSRVIALSPSDGGTNSFCQIINGSDERSTATELRFERTKQKSLFFWSFLIWPSVEEYVYTCIPVLVWFLQSAQARNDFYSNQVLSLTKSKYIFFFNIIWVLEQYYWKYIDDN